MLDRVVVVELIVVDMIALMLDGDIVGFDAYLVLGNASLAPF